MKELLVVEDLSVGYNDKKIFNNLSFTVSKHSLTAILCPNNGGKTSLIKTLSGVVCPKKGKIFVNGIALSKKNFKKYILNVGVVFEDIDRMFICDKVIDELEFPLINLSCKRKTIKSRIKCISEIVRIDSILDRSISSLSYMEKVKVLIAVSIIHLPKILLLDDVFKMLNLKERKEIFKILKNIIDKLETSVIFTSSDVNDVIDIDDIIVLGNGEQVIVGNFSTVIMQDNELAKLGFDIPIMIDLSRKLQFYDLLDGIYYDVDKVVDKLWK